ncbi:hypothetical protein A1507_11080 [Methylomonas koyamae]|uniref:Cobalamin biosynthesis protein CobD n=1 Tax=Methylomonas koyamae TaxID=702114 RepID=A0A177NJV5_9GAMM|nr:adenosylcobinamide-phosphate synthase CbiB [Methylomonas koyamae]OAI17320.1 hypothetical protein A1507_11080 [Methylomonas koyamae]
MALFSIVLLAVALDYVLGEPGNTYHPLAAFGRWAAWLEQRLLIPEQTPARQKIAGVCALLSALLPCAAALPLLLLTEAWQTLFGIILLYFCIAPRSLQQHAEAVRTALAAGDLELARSRVAYMVSRETADLDAAGVRRAAIESVLENGADAVFAPIFWFVVAGPFAAVLYRFSNTLDAMWGYRNRRYQYFGCAAARLDDVLNWAPARLTALSYALLGRTGPALQAWREQAALLESPNAGPVMAAGGAALNLRLGGPAVYHGQLKAKPWFGGEIVPENSDIARAGGLVYRVLGLWLMLIAIGGGFA